MKHYHMSPAQLRRRTSMLGLPGDIYDKYDRVVKSCKVCSTSVPSPPRARIAHAEIKFGTSQYLVLLIIDGASFKTCSCKIVKTLTYGRSMLGYVAPPSKNPQGAAAKADAIPPPDSPHPKGAAKGRDSWSSSPKSPAKAQVQGEVKGKSHV